MFKLFTQHPANVGESYFQHMRFALTFSARLFAAALAALVHGLFPFLCQCTASKIVMRMCQQMDTRTQKDNCTKADV